MIGRAWQGLRRILPGGRTDDAGVAGARAGGPEVVAMPDARSSAVTFFWHGGADVVVDVHLAGYVGTGVEQGVRLVRGDDGRHAVTMVLPDDTCVSYGYRVSPAAGHPAAGHPAPDHPAPDHPALDREQLDAPAVLDSLVADPTNPVIVQGAFGSAGASSILELSRARRHPAFVAAHDTDAKPAASETLETYRTGRTVTMARGDADGAIVVVLDGDPWARSDFGFLQAWECWTPPADGPKPTLALASVPDRELLTDRRAMRSLLVDDVLPVLEEDASTGQGVVVVGQDFGALAAAGLLVDVPHVVVAAVCQSGAYWHDEESGRRDRPGPLTQEIAATQRALATAARRRVVVQAGTTEREMLGMSEAFARACRWAGLTTSFDVFSGGRDYAWYRHGLLFGLDRILADGAL